MMKKRKNASFRKVASCVSADAKSTWMASIIARATPVATLAVFRTAQLGI